MMLLMSASLQLARQIAKEIEQEYGIRLQYYGDEKVNKIVTDKLAETLRKKGVDLTTTSLDIRTRYKVTIEQIYDELRTLGVLKD